MKQIRGLIPRRRPAVPPARPDDPPSVELPPEPVATPPSGREAQDLERVRLGRDAKPAVAMTRRVEPRRRTMEDNPKATRPIAQPEHPAPDTFEPRAPRSPQPEPSVNGTAQTPAIWDLEAPEPYEAPQPAPLRMIDPAPEVAASAPQADVVDPPAVGQGRVRTRLIGFASDAAPDAFEEAVATAGETRFPTGWLVVVEGPGRGASFTLTAGLSTIGRGDDQAVRLDFGDTSISRSSHAAIVYDPEDRRVLIGHGGKSNIVRLNGDPLLSREELASGDLIRIGKTTLRFVALCGAEFDWGEAGEADG